jgi:hypothetical protein
MSLVLMKNYKSKNDFTSERNKRMKNSPREKDGLSSRGNINLGALGFFMIICLVFSGAVYLSQVNGIAIKGFEVRDMEKKIQSLEKQNQKLKIQEVELASMNNIEKSMNDFNLVSPSSISYIEINSPVAMR